MCYPTQSQNPLFNPSQIVFGSFSDFFQIPLFILYSASLHLEKRKLVTKHCKQFLGGYFVVLMCVFSWTFGCSISEISALSFMASFRQKISPTLLGLTLQRG